jgi:m7GpppX diphosphatase
MDKELESSNTNSEVKSENILSKILLNSSVSFLEILEENPDRCYFTILGKFNNKDTNKDENFVIKIKKKEFNLNDIQTISEKVKKVLSSPEQKFNNDIYYKFLTNDLIENKCKVDVIYPADSKVIDKYKRKNFMLFKETPEIYNEKTLKYIQSLDLSYVKWIHNILYNNSEKIIHQVENVLVITQDYNSKDNENLLNCLGIPFNNKIFSIRDLNETHLELLEKFYKARKALANYFKVHKNQIRCFVHYPPSFYYLHVHYLHVEYESSSTTINRAIDLHTIINNIKLKSDYYQTMPLEILLQKGSKLYNALHS